MTTKLFIQTILHNAMIHKAKEIADISPYCAMLSVEPEDIGIKQYTSAFGNTVYETDTYYGVYVFNEQTEINFIASASIDENGNIAAYVERA